MRNLELVQLLISNNYKISCAESCTGGMLASAIVDVADASKVLDMSFVTYANEAKINLLGVKEDAIKEFGVVSEEVAIQMAKGVQKLANSNIGIGISGIAGPTGDTPTKPIGMVCFGIVINDKSLSFTKYFGNLGRNVVRECAVGFLFETLYMLLG